MKKVLKISLIVLSSVVVLVGGFVAYDFLNGHCFYTYDGSSENTEWMKSISDKALVNQMLIPGSHDAGTDGMLHFFETQSISIKDQLEFGVRYFDLRTEKKDDGKMYVYHGDATGNDMESILDNFHDFLVAHPSETLLLDFQHFRGAANDSVLSILTEKFYKENLLVSCPEGEDSLNFVSHLTLGEARGKAIAFFGEASKDDKYTSNSYIFFRNDDDSGQKGADLNSTYFTDYHTKTSKYLIDTIFPKYYQMIEDKITEEGNKGFFVLQAQLTDGRYIFGPYSREKTHEENMNKYLKALPESDTFQYTNIILRDFLTEEKADTIIKLNQYRNF